MHYRLHVPPALDSENAQRLVVHAQQFIGLVYSAGLHVWLRLYASVTKSSVQCAVISFRQFCTVNSVLVPQRNTGL